MLVGVPADAAASCDNIPAAATVTATDNCDDSPSVSLDEQSTQSTDLESCAHYSYTITRTWTATDACGNTSTGVQVITVSDNSDPVISCPAAITINCEDSQLPANTGTATATDNCDNSPAITYADAIVGGNCAGNYTINRTWTATDACGNSSTCLQVITVHDVTGPVITCPANITHTADAGVCSYTVNVGVATATDCQTPSVAGVRSDALALNAPYPVGVTTITWTATDVCGNSSTCLQTVTVTDNENPVTICQNITVNLGPTGTVTITPAMINNGSTDNCGIQSLSLSNTTFNCSNAIGIPTDLIISEYVEGSSSNKYIELYNPTAGTINLGDYRLRLYANGATSPTNDNLLSGSLGAGQTIVYKNSSATIYGGAATNMTAVNFNGDDAVVLFKISSNSNVDIFGRIGEDPGTAWTGGGNSTLDKTLRRNSNVWKGVTSNPLAGFPTLSTEWTQLNIDDVTGLGSQVFGNAVTLTVTDIHGNSSTCTATVTVLDVTPPVITCPAPITINCQASQLPANTGTATATDNCSVATITSSDVSSQDPNANLCAHYNYTITRTWTATDVNGNSSTCVQTITVQDVTAPVITCPADVTVNCQDDKTSVATGVATATDNCSPVTITQSETNDQDPSVTSCNHYNYTITRTWTATDACGNSSSCVQLIHVQDVTAPVITCPADATVNCQDDNTSTATGTATATDNCSPVTITQSQTSTQNPSVASCNHYNYTITRTWTATDACGNSSSCVQLIHVQDVTAPVITCVPAQTRSMNTGVCTYTAVGTEFDATATDNCSSPVSYSYVLSGVTPGSGNTTLSGKVFLKGVTTVTWTAMDACGNTSTCSFTVTVNDTELPVITCPANVSVSADASQCYATISLGTIGTATATDNCGVLTIFGTRSDAQPLTAIYPVGITTITWNVSDINGNPRSCQQTITVIGNAPTITCNPNVTVFADPNNCSVTAFHAGVVTLAGVPIPPTVNASCGIFGVFGVRNDLQPLNAPYPVGTTEIFWTAIDVFSNQVSCRQTVTVIDNQPPVISNCPSSFTFNSNSGNTSTCSQIVSWTPPTATDNCGTILNPVTVVASHTPGSVFPLGATTVTYVFTDTHNNSSTCSFVITVVDNTPPLITQAAASSTVECGAGNTAALNAWLASNGGASASDNCGGVITWSHNFTSLSDLCGATGSATVTFTATDTNNNTSTTTATFTIQDTQAPVLVGSIPAGATNQNVCYANIPTGPSEEAIAALYLDNCGAVHVEKTGTPTGSNCSWTVTYHYEITDDCGNSATAVDITYSGGDTEDPIVTAPTGADLECADDLPLAVTTIADFNALAGADASDNCTLTANLTVSHSDVVTVAGSCNGVITRTYTITDDCNNTSTVDQLFTVTDNTDPIVTAPDGADLECADALPAAATTIAQFNALSGAAASDNCTLTGDLQVSHVDVVTTPGSCNGLITRTYTITDDCN
ncbi:MAG: HYR domain-containing protein, partial [Vicinamibacterales bacterium]